MGSLPPSEDGGDGWVEDPRPRRRAAAGQPQLSRRDRQQVYLVQDIARELENNQPGTIHEIKLVFSGRRLHASIVFDRHRGVEARDGAAQRSSRADCAPATTGSHGSVGSNAGQQPRQLPTNRAREYKGPTRPVQNARLGAAQPEPKPHRAGIPAGRDRPAAAAHLTKVDVGIIERTMKAAITPIVRALGGDEKDGAKYLSEPFKVPLGNFKTGPIRVPLGSRAHKMHSMRPGRAAEDIGAMVLTKYLDKSRTSREVEIVMDSLFKPLDNQMET